MSGDGGRGGDACEDLAIRASAWLTWQRFPEKPVGHRHWNLLISF